MTATNERRRDDGAAVSMVAVVFARHNQGVSMTVEGVSIGGARLSGAGTFQQGELVGLVFDVDGSPLEVSGEVVRVEHQNLVNDRIAVRFLSLTDLQRGMIRALVVASLDDRGCSTKSG